MLASLLPGLRDLRTPLATGYLWLVALWLMLHDYVPRSNGEATGSIRSIYELGQLLGPTAVLAAVSFVAYLLGTMLTFGSNRSYIHYIPFLWAPFGMNVFSIPNKIKRLYVKTFHARASMGLALQLRTFVEAVLRKNPTLDLDDHDEILRLGNLIRIEQVSDAVLTDMYAMTIVYEFPAIGVQLQANSHDYWDTFDRQSAEAQFRFCIAPPLCVLLVLASLQSTGWWLLLLVAPIYLTVLGFRQVLQAASTLVQAVVLRMVEPPVLERLKEAVAKKTQDSGAPPHD